jgi:septal ring factor EnvC (AmiA/AmiB activator)
MNTLFEDMPGGVATPPDNEEVPLDRLKDLDAKIAGAIEKVKSLKEENSSLHSRIRELEDSIAEKDAELRTVSSEKTVIKDQILDLLDELESIETVQQ